VAVSLDDDGNIPNPEYYPQVGDTLTMTYAKDVEYIDSRTGELSTEDTPEEYIEEKMVGAYDVDYTVCALVEEPYSMSYRYYGMGYDTILSEETAKRDRSGDVVPMIYLFDTPDEASETAAEEYLADLTGSVSSPLMYESKATVRAEFSQYEQMFLLVGGVLCTIIALVGILNFFNSIMTGILSRRREFAVIQSVGMTSRQLRAMLIYEGLFYALSSVSAALILSLVLEPLAGKVLASMYWFYDYHFTIFPVLLTIPVFVVLGVLIPMALYGQAAKQSVVERLREAK
jgi:putative ABC transport system permease protein